MRRPGLADGHQAEQRPRRLRRGADAVAGKRGIVIGVARFAPAAVLVLGVLQPLHGFAHIGLRDIFADGTERGEYAPSAVDVVHAPAPIPRTVFFLVALQELESALDGREARVVAEHREQLHAACRQIRGTRVDQRAVIGKRNLVQILVIVADVECAPAAVRILHAEQPIDRLVDAFQLVRLVVRAGPQQRHQHHPGIVDIRVFVVFVLESPATRFETRRLIAPVAGNENLMIEQPLDSLRDSRMIGRRTGFRQRVQRQAGVPDRRHAGLDIGLRLTIQHEVFDRLDGADQIRIVALRAEHGQGHRRVGHRRIDGAQTALALGVIAHPVLGALQGPFANEIGDHRLNGLQDPIEQNEAILERLAGTEMIEVAQLHRRRCEQFGDTQMVVDMHHRPPCKQDQQGHDYAARPVRHLTQVEEPPTRQKHDLDRHRRYRAPRQLPENRKRDAGKHIHRAGAAVAQYPMAAAHHVGRVQ